MVFYIILLQLMQQMRPHYLRTSDIAKAVDVHPNTVRLYEAWGFLPPIPRSSSGYRLFTEVHLDQMRLARTALAGPWPGRNIKQSGLSLVKQAASGDLGGALEQAYTHLALVQAERAQAEAAAVFLERWAQGADADATVRTLQISDAAELLGLTPDILRNWERDGLINVPRNPRNNYRLYGAAELGHLRVIRMLRRAGYSTLEVLRMLRHLDQGRAGNACRKLGVSLPDQDVHPAADQWLSALGAQERRAMDIIAQLEKMIGKRQE